MTASIPLTAAEARRAARSAAALTLARIISSGALFGWQLILGRWLGDTEYGVYGTILALFTLGATFGLFGLSLIAIRESARRPERASAVFTAALAIATVTTAIAYVAINLAAALLGYPDHLRALLGLAGLALFTDTAGTLAYDQLIARERMVNASAVEVGHILGRIALAALVLAAGFGLTGVYLITLLTSLLRAAVLWGLAARSGVSLRFPVDAIWRRRLIGDALPLALAAFINQAYTYIDRLIATSLLSSAATGQLTAAFVIVVGVVEILSTTVLVAVFPLMARAYQPDQPDGGTQFGFLVEKLALYTLLISIPLGLVFTTAADAITVPLFGTDFQPAADVLRVLIWYAGLTMIVNVFAQSLMVQNRQRRYVTLRTGGLILKLGLNLALLPALGVIGAAAASVIAELVVLIAVGRAAGGAAQRHPSALRLGRVALAAAASAGAAVFLMTFAHPLIAALGAGVAYLLSGLALRVVDTDDRALLRTLLRRRAA